MDGIKVYHISTLEAAAIAGDVWAMPLLGLAYSLGDPAGRGAAERLAELAGAEQCPSRGRVATCWRGEGFLLTGYREDTVSLEFLAETMPEAEGYIVLSRHASTSGRPTLSLHYPGNPGPEAGLGGRPWELAWTWPRLFALLTRVYHDEARRRGLLERYSFSLEATHHGPTSVPKPVMFIEIGSTPEEWSDTTAQEAMAAAVLRTVKDYLDGGLERLSCRRAVGVGGTHYPDKHTRLQLEGRYCYGHIFAKYTFQNLDRELLLQAVKKSVEPVEAIVVLKVPSRIKRLAEEAAGEAGVAVERP